MIHKCLSLKVCQNTVMGYWIIKKTGCYDLFYIPKSFGSIKVWNMFITFVYGVLFCGGPFWHVHHQFWHFEKLENLVCFKSDECQDSNSQESQRDCSAWFFLQAQPQIDKLHASISMQNVTILFTSQIIIKLKLKLNATWLFTCQRIIKRKLKLRQLFNNGQQIMEIKQLWECMG